MFYKEGAHSHRVPGEVRAIISRVAVPFKGIREGVEGGRGKTTLIDVRERAAESGEAQTEQEDIGGRAFEGGNKWECVKTAAVVMNLAFDAL